MSVLQLYLKVTKAVSDLSLKVLLEKPVALDKALIRQ